MEKTKLYSMSSLTSGNFARENVKFHKEATKCIIIYNRDSQHPTFDI